MSLDFSDIATPIKGMEEEKKKEYIKPRVVPFEPQKVQAQAQEQVAEPGGMDFSDIAYPVGKQPQNNGGINGETDPSIYRRDKPITGQTYKKDSPLFLLQEIERVSKEQGRKGYQADLVAKENNEKQIASLVDPVAREQKYNEYYKQPVMERLKTDGKPQEPEAVLAPLHPNSKPRWSSDNESLRSFLSRTPNSAGSLVSPKEAQELSVAGTTSAISSLKDGTTGIPDVIIDAIGRELKPKDPIAHPTRDKIADGIVKYNPFGAFNKGVDIFTTQLNDRYGPELKEYDPEEGWTQFLTANNIASGVGSVAGYAGGAALWAGLLGPGLMAKAATNPKLVKQIVAVGQASIEGISEGVRVYKEVIDLTDGDQRQAMSAMAKTIALNLPLDVATNLVGLAGDNEVSRKALGTLIKAMGPKNMTPEMVDQFAGIVATAISSFFAEGTQEFGQAIISEKYGKNMKLKDIFTKKKLRELFVTEAVPGAIVGAIVGGGVGSFANEAKFSKQTQFAAINKLNALNRIPLEKLTDVEKKQKETLTKAVEHFDSGKRDKGAEELHKGGIRFDFSTKADRDIVDPAEAYKQEQQKKEDAKQLKHGLDFMYVGKPKPVNDGYIIDQGDGKGKFVKEADIGNFKHMGHYSTDEAIAKHEQQTRIIEATKTDVKSELDRINAIPVKKRNKYDKGLHKILTSADESFEKNDTSAAMQTLSEGNVEFSFGEDVMGPPVAETGQAVVAEEKTGEETTPPVTFYGTTTNDAYRTKDGKMLQVTDVTEKKVTLTDLQGKSISISHDKLGSDKYTRFSNRVRPTAPTQTITKSQASPVTAPTGTKGTTTATATPMSSATNTTQAELKPVAINDKFQDKNGEELTVSSITANRITLRTADNKVKHMTNKDIENGKYTAVQAPQADVVQEVATKKPTIKKETGPFKSIPVEERMAQGASQIAEVTDGGIRIVDNKTSKNLEHSVVSNEEIANIYKNSKDVDRDLTKLLATKYDEAHENWLKTITSPRTQELATDLWRHDTISGKFSPAVAQTIQEQVKAVKDAYNQGVTTDTTQTVTPVAVTPKEAKIEKQTKIKEEKEQELKKEIKEKVTKAKEAKKEVVAKEEVEVAKKEVAKKEVAKKEVAKKETKKETKKEQDVKESKKLAEQKALQKAIEEATKETKRDVEREIKNASKKTKKSDKKLKVTNTFTKTLPPVTLKQITSSVPGANVYETDGGLIVATFKNGSSLVIDPKVSAIKIDADVMARDYKREIQKGDIAIGSSQVIGGQGFIELVSGMTDMKTFNHELFHIAKRMYLTQKQISILDQAYANEEAQAEAYADTAFKRDKAKNTLVGSIFQKMSDFFSKIKSKLFGEKAEDIFRKIAEGQIYEQAVFENESSVKLDKSYDVKKGEGLLKIVPGLGHVWPHLQTEERAKLRKDTATKMVSMFNSMPDSQEMASVAYAGRAKRGWYKYSTKVINHVFGAVDAPRFSALLAALSPQASVQMNLLNTVNVWGNWVEAGKPTNKAEIKTILANSVIGVKVEKSVLKAWEDNVVRALTSTDLSKLVISGPKVNSFMLNLHGIMNEVTLDTWMATYAAMDQTIFKGTINKAGTDPGKIPGYLAMSAKIRETANIISKRTDSKWSAAEVQECIWSWTKTLLEKSTKDLTVAQIVEAGLLTHEEIANTPDFASLFIDNLYSRALEKVEGKDYGEKIQSIRDGEFASSNRENVRYTGDTSDATGSGINERAYKKHLEKSAERLEKVRKRRIGEAPRGEAWGILRKRYVRGLSDVGLEKNVPKPYRTTNKTGSVRVAGLDLTGTIYAPTGMAVKEMGYTSDTAQSFVELVKTKKSAEAFKKIMTEACERNPYSAAVEIQDASNYKGMRLFVSKDGSSGFALDGKDLVSVFSSAVDESDTARGKIGGVMFLAVQEGARTLDCYDTVLPVIYAKMGFRAVSRVKFDEGQAQSNWSKELFSDFNEGQPDLVFMKYDPNYFEAYVQGEGKMLDYDEAMKLRNETEFDVETEPDFTKSFSIINYGDKKMQAEVIKLQEATAKETEQELKELEYVEPGTVETKQDISVTEKGAKDVAVPKGKVTKASEIAKKYGLEKIVHTELNDKPFNERVTWLFETLRNEIFDSEGPIRDQCGIATYKVVRSSLDGAGMAAEGLLTLGDSESGTKGLKPIFKDLSPEAAEALLYVGEYRNTLDILALSDQIVESLSDIEMLKDRELAKLEDLEDTDADDYGSQTDLTQAIAKTKRYIAQLEKEYDNTAKDYREARGLAGDYVSAIKELETQHPEIVQKQKDLVKYNRFLLRKLRDSGMVSANLFNYLEKTRPNYIPAQRDFSDVGGEIGFEAFSSSKGLVNLRVPIRKQTGSKRDFANPIDEMIKSTMRIFKLTGKQNAASAVIDHINSLEDGSETIWRTELGKPKQPGEYQFFIWEDGEKQYYATTDKSMHDAIALEATSADNMGMMGKFANKWVKMLRAGVTRGITFSLGRNLQRDTTQAAALGEHFMPVYTTLKGMFMYAQRGRNAEFANLWEQFMKNGGALGLSHMNPKDAIAFRKEIMGEKTLNPITHITKVLDKLTDLSEYGTRFGQFVTAMDHNFSPAESAYIAHNLMNFAIAGRSARILNRYVPFLTPGLQDLNKIWRTYTNKKEAARVTKNAFLKLTLPTMALWAWNNSDDERRKHWQRIEPWKKNLYWYFIINGDHAIAFAKPFTLGLMFASIPERFLDYAFYKKKMDAGDFVKTILGQTLPGYMPLALANLFEWNANYDSFRDQPIVPRSQQDIDAREQYGPYTSEWAITMGKLTGLSPRKIDHAFLANTGSLGREGSELLNTVWRAASGKTDPKKYPYEYVPFAKAWIVPTRGFMGPLNEWNKRFKKLEKTMNTIKYCAKRDGVDSLTPQQLNLYKKRQAISQLGKINSSKNGGIWKLYRMKNDIVNSKTMSAKEKRARIDDLDNRMINLALVGLDRIVGFEEGVDSTRNVMKSRTKDKKTKKGQWASDAYMDN